MKTCAVMAAIWMEPSLVEIVRRIAERFERLNNMEVRVIVDQDLSGKFLSSSYYAKYHAWKQVPSDIERIIYLDTDMLPLRPLPELPDVDFAAAPERKEIYDECSAAWPIIQRTGTYFNAGMLIATRKAEHIFQRMILRQTHSIGGEAPWFGEQSFMNIEVFSAVEAGEITFQQLPRSWNQLILIDTYEPPPPEAHMLHFAGGHNAKLRIISHAMEQFTNLERMIDIKKQYARG